MNGTNAGSMVPSLAIMVVFIIVMYFMLIKPQKKKDQEVQDMRNNVQIGDEIVSIGGICGRIVKVKDDSIVIQVGADKTKFEIKKWAISSVEKKSETRKVDRSEVVEQEEKKVKPRRLGKKASSMEEEAQALFENAEQDAVETSQEVMDAAETATDDTVSE